MRTSPQPQKRTPGLASIEQARRERARGKFTRPTPKLLLWGIGGVVLSMVLYTVISQRELNTRKNKVLAKQRAALTELGPLWHPMRDRVESTALALAKEWPGDKIDPQTPLAELTSSPGLYLRLRASEAQSVPALRAAAKESLRDGFVGCFARATKAPTDLDAGAFPDQPWNLRQAYAATRILGEPWVNEVQEAGDDLRLRVFEQQLEAANKTEIPLAVEMVKQARYFLLVLDEDVPEARAEDGGISDESLQLVAHPARVALVDLRSDRTFARLRRTAAGTFLPLGERPVTDPTVRDAMQRQVNNCALARTVLDEIRTATKP